ncbi:hypothetical protein K376_05677 [Streptomyces sp. PsTaAH-130]|nr:hypothetical protein K376_05677 [Streptomyces sp. PsTaAH-130]
MGEQGGCFGFFVGRRPHYRCPIGGYRQGERALAFAPASLGVGLAARIYWLSALAIPDKVCVIGRFGILATIVLVRAASRAELPGDEDTDDCGHVNAGCGDGPSGVPQVGEVCRQRRHDRQGGQAENLPRARHSVRLTQVGALHLMAVPLLILSHTDYPVSETWQSLLIAGQHLRRWQRPSKREFTTHHTHRPLDVSQRLHNARICNLLDLCHVRRVGGTL